MAKQQSVLYEELRLAIGNYIKEKINRSQKTQTVLANESGISQPMISSICSGKGTLPNICKLLESLGITSVNQLLEDVEAGSPCRTFLDELSKGWIDTSIIKEEELLPYLGKFHTYFYATNKNEDRLLHGVMSLENKHKEIAVQFVLDIASENGREKAEQKKYNGNAIISQIQQAIYILLASADARELCFLILPYAGMVNSTHLIQCTMAEALTVSSGMNDRKPTVHRVFLCRNKISDTEEKAIRAQLLMNKYLIRISREEFENLRINHMISEEFCEMFMRHMEENEYYEIKESVFADMIKSSEYFMDLCMLRLHSAAYSNNKIANSIIKNIFYSLLRDSETVVNSLGNIR